MTTVDQLPPRIRRKIRIEPPPPSPIPIRAKGDCWTWTGCCNNKGYGDVTFGRRNRWLLHRWTYTTLVGEIPSGLQLDHLCRNTACCRPAHLEPVTHRVNSHRGVRRSSTTCGRGVHQLSGHNLIIRQGQYGPRRECRECKYDSQRRSKARRDGQQLPPGDPRHGITGYMGPFRCKCEICRAAGSASNRRAYLKRHGQMAASA